MQFLCTCTNGVQYIILNFERKRHDVERDSIQVWVSSFEAGSCYFEQVAASPCGSESQCLLFAPAQILTLVLFIYLFS